MSFPTAERGICYFLWGTKHAIELVTSITALRRRCDLPVCILTPDPDGPAHAMAADSRLRVSVKHMPLCVVGRRNSAFVTKTWVHRYTPFECTLFLDADTIPVDIHPSIWPTRERQVTWTAFSDWKLLGSPYEARCRRPFDNDMLPIELWDKRRAENAEAVNNGVWAFWLGAECLEPIHEVCKKIHSVFIPDEVSVQLLYRDYPHQLRDHRWNHSPRHGRFPDSGVNVWHCHGSKQLHRRTRGLWLHCFEEARRENYGGVRDYVHPELANYVRLAEKEGGF